MMSRIFNRINNMSMGLRIALLSWVISLVSICVFVLVIIPQQKKVLLKNLESKANSVAVSLHDTASGAAVNEDFASLVSASQTLLAGDPELDFLIICKNDGYALINERSKWSVEESIDAYWKSGERKPSGAIGPVPLLNTRCFHYRQPFDYSGVEWGWIHVGLSLESYDRNVRDIYWYSANLALGCIAFSLFFSIFYGQRLVQPALRLRQVVDQIASGDLSRRAQVVHKDELGALAEAVNVMADALQRRDRILSSMRYTAQRFLYASDLSGVTVEVLQKIGESTDASRAYVFENYTDNDGRICCAQRYEWVASGIEPQMANPQLQGLSYEDAGVGRWLEVMRREGVICGLISVLPAEEQEIFRVQQILSIMAIPIFVEGAWWGFIGLDDCLEERVWTQAEQDSLRAGADMLGAAITRQGSQDALIKAKNTLEERVRERTLELVDQIAAKEQTLSELAAAQSSLVKLSRAAGMAEVATGVLHNVGNVLNSVNVSCTLIRDQLRESRVSNVSKVAELMDRPEAELDYFLTRDPRGKQIPTYLVSLAQVLQDEHDLLLTETSALHSRVEHIKEIVAMQQTYGRVMGVLETMPPEQLMEDALKLNIEALSRHEIKVLREYAPVAAITVDKHKVLQILLNLINNAKYASSQGPNRDKRITLRIFSSSPDRVSLAVEDQGMGISAENLTRIFQHGFSTRRDGHGFGLHSGALAARELGGSLTAHSDGPGRGATFVLELPLHPGEKP